MAKKASHARDKRRQAGSSSSSTQVSQLRRSWSGFVLHPHQRLDQLQRHFLVLRATRSPSQREGGDGRGPRHKRGSFHAQAVIRIDKFSRPRNWPFGVRLWAESCSQARSTCVIFRSRLHQMSEVDCTAEEASAADSNRPTSSRSDDRKSTSAMTAFEGAADVAQSPPAATKTTKRSINDNRCLAGTLLGRVPACQRPEVALPTRNRPSKAVSHRLKAATESARMSIRHMAPLWQCPDGVDEMDRCTST